MSVLAERRIFFAIAAQYIGPNDIFKSTRVLKVSRLISEAVKGCHKWVDNVNQWLALAHSVLPSLFCVEISKGIACPRGAVVISNVGLEIATVAGLV